MSKKFEVNFSSHTNISPSFVYVSPSTSHQGFFSVSILYVLNNSGSFQSPAGIEKEFDLKQDIFSSESEAILWAQGWLLAKSGVNVTLKEI